MSYLKLVNKLSHLQLLDILPEMYPKNEFIKSGKIVLDTQSLAILFCGIKILALNEPI